MEDGYKFAILHTNSTECSNIKYLNNNNIVYIYNAKLSGMWHF